MVNPWLTHLKAYAAAHPDLKYAQAMKAARASYKPVKPTTGNGKKKSRRR